LSIIDTNMFFLYTSSFWIYWFSMGQLYWKRSKRIRKCRGVRSTNL
jgi:hypothetical protein